jgi:type 1 fimbriae regulatory protein FimB/type 1 fimbriae regulatory protein FimE
LTVALGKFDMAQSSTGQEKPKVQDRSPFSPGDGPRLHLRPDEAQRLITAAGKRGRYPFRDRVMVRMVYRHGMRASEACGLRWDDVDLDHGTLFVRRKKMGNASCHTMDQDEIRDLRKLKAERGTSLYVFTTERGGPLSVDALQYIVREAGKLAKLDVEAHPHMLRHAAGYYLINNNTDVRTVQAFLGHKSINTTAHYTALAPGRLAAVRVR